MVYHERVLCNYVISGQNSVASKINEIYSWRKVEFNTVEYTTIFFSSEWLYFLWHGINTYIAYIKEIHPFWEHSNSVSEVS